MSLNKAINRAYLEVNGDQVICDSIDIDPENDSDFITGMTPDNEPLGTTSGNRRYRVRADVTAREEEDVDFHQMWVDEDNVPVEIEFEGGKTWAFSYGVIAKPGIGAAHGDKAKWTLEMLCWGLQIS